MGFSQFALMHILLHLLCISLAFWVLKGVSIESLFNKGETGRIRLVIILLSILLGTALSNFIMDIFRYTQEASLLFS
ncbi:DUF1146 family protein [Jeotgalicoccus halotolerans]|uniref:Putative integral membrane protein (TIGR02327 family) n=1 Tax=Jeotgalicoccus halotolerans TaxID=157227 RepID=A0A3E0AWS4_9STAP|nr:DUF1146 family protein [Jeotgalicoccus halotolerans]REG24190.1 putative integral membrane protein (TIGR02327 family) [Jeotgalicoccus halotolerans]